MRVLIAEHDHALYAQLLRQAAPDLEVLTSETNYFAAQLSLARARLNERLSLVQVYQALGGGWDI